MVFLKQEIGATTNRMYQVNNMQSMNYFITKIAKGLDPNEIKCWEFKKQIEKSNSKIPNTHQMVSDKVLKLNTCYPYIRVHKNEK